MIELHPDDEALAARAGDPVRNGVPSEEDAARRTLAAVDAADALAGLLRPGGLALSPLGAAWSSDVDAHVTAMPEDAQLRARGWIGLDSLLRRVGSRARGRWAIVADGRVVGAADLSVDAPPEPIGAVLARCRRRGEVRLREVLELRELLRAGHDPDAAGAATDPALAAIADVEAGLGGALLGAWRGGRDLPCPTPLTLPAATRARRSAGGARRRMRPRVVLALSGVDGSGKSTLAGEVERGLRAAGVPVSRVWARPGMNIGWLDRVARLAKRARGQSTDPGVRAVAAGEGEALASRRGVVGWLWALLVTASFLADVWRQHLSGEGVILYDRHLVDALATLEFVYAGSDLRIQRALVRRLMPRADLSVYLEVDVATAVARKPGDTFGEHAVREQLARYGAWLERYRPGLRVNAGLPPHETAREVIQRLCG